MRACSLRVQFLISISPGQARVLKVLCIDGGGYCCLSGLLTIKHLLGAADYRASSLDEISPRPSDHFDLICGVGSGGLVAILLGRLRLRCDEAIEAYVSLGRLAYSEQLEEGQPAILARGNLVALRQGLERIVETALGNKNALMKEAIEAKQTCYVSKDQLTRIISPVLFYTAQRHLWG